MKSITLKNFGGPEVLQLEEVPLPVPGKDQLLVQVKARALNRADMLQRRGKYPPPPGESSILGLEIAGDVVDSGPGVSGFSKGQRVFGLVGGGAYAEYCLLDTGMAMPIPSNFSYIEAAAIPEAFFTASETLFHVGQLQEGESVLIHAGASGVGTAAIQLAMQMKAKIFFTAGSEEKIAKVKNLFQEYSNLFGINYKKEDFSKDILEKNQGVDLILDFVGASYLSQHIKLLKPQGRLVCIGLMGGAKAEIDLSPVLMKRLQIKGFALRGQTLMEKRAITQQFMEHWYECLTSGKMKPIVDSVFPLEEASRAHEFMESNKNVGKIILI